MIAAGGHGYRQKVTRRAAKVLIIGTIAILFNASTVVAQDRYELPPLSDLGLDPVVLARFSDHPTTGPTLIDPVPDQYLQPGLAEPGFAGRPHLRDPSLSPLDRQSRGTQLTSPLRGTSDASLFPSSSSLPRLATNVDRFDFTGNSFFEASALSKIVNVERFTGSVTSEDLEAARVKLTRHFIEEGYANSGVLLPDQQVTHGTVTLQIVEGKLSEILPEGNYWLNDRYLVNRIRMGAKADRPLRMRDLEKPLRILRRNRNIRKLDAELKPDVEPGKSYLNVTIHEKSPIRGGIEFSNDRPPSVGEEQIDLWLIDTSLVPGHGDTLELRYGLLDNGFEGGDSTGFKSFMASYTRPLTRWDTEFKASYSRNSFTILEEPFEELEIEGESSLWRAGLRQPFYWFGEKKDRSVVEHEFSLGLYFERIQNETTLLGAPFSTTAGAHNGEIELSALRFTQAYTRRSRKQVLALQSTASFGIDVGNVTDNGTERDGDYVSWLGQAQYVRRLGSTDAQIILRGTVQVSNDPLLSPEQFSLGGAYTVRGYRENQLVRDMGYVGSIEIRIPIPGVRNKHGNKMFTLAPFVDVGAGWNKEMNETLTPIDGTDSKTIVSAGVGLLFQPNDWIDASLYWGHGFTNFESSGDNLQDSGIHFRVTVGRF